MGPAGWRASFNNTLSLRNEVGLKAGKRCFVQRLICMARALLGFCAITLAHTACIVAHRVSQVLRGVPVTGFKKSRTELETSLYGRICASHANCLENLP